MLFRVEVRYLASVCCSYSLSWGDWNRPKREYKGFYPRTIVYQLTVSCAVVI
jgi:hypothetical protein